MNTPAQRARDQALARHKKELSFVRTMAMAISSLALIVGIALGVVISGWAARMDELRHDHPIPNTPVYGVVRIYRLAGQDTCRSFDTGQPVEVYGWTPDKP